MKIFSDLFAFATIFIGFSSILCADEISILASIIDDAGIMEKITHACENASKEEKKTNIAEIQKQLFEAQGKFLKLTPPAQKNNAQDVYNSVAVIAGGYKCGRCPNWHVRSSGTAWVAHEDGYIVTNFHVVEKAPQGIIMAIYFPNGDIYTDFSVVASDKKKDIAILKINKKLKNPLKVIAKNPNIATKLHLISHPEGHFYYYTNGYISRYAFDKVPNQKLENRISWMFTTCDYAIGSSGGAFFDNNCEIIGMVSSTTTIFYSSKKAETNQPQMVIHRTVPADALREILYGEK